MKKKTREQKRGELVKAKVARRVSKFSRKLEREVGTDSIAAFIRQAIAEKKSPST